MIPSLLDQVIAARIPSKAERVLSDRTDERARMVLDAVQSIGNASAKDVAQVTGFKEKSARELLRLLVERGRLATWKPQQNNLPRRWALVSPPARRQQ